MGEWIPEPLPDLQEWISGQAGGTTADPADRVTLDESINMAFLVVLESMTPAERVAFILHDVFRYPFPKWPRSSAVRRRHAASWPSSARRRIRASQAPPTPRPSGPARARTSSRHGKRRTSTALIGLLDPDATAIADGGGLVAPTSSRSRAASRSPVT